MADGVVETLVPEGTPGTVEAVEAVDQQERRFRSLAESIPLGVFHMGPDGRIRYANDEFHRITGLGQGDGDTFSIIVPEDVERTVEVVERFVQTGDRLDIVHGISHPVSGDVRRIRVLAHALREAGGGALEIVGSVEDVTEREAFAAQLVHEATHDALTGLTNRSAFLKVAEERLAHRPAGSEVAILFIDLDGFKALNDSGGHRTGDLVLTAIAARLRNSVRTSDLVGRIGGDEFVVLTNVVEGPDGVLGLAHRLCREVEEPLAVGAASVQVRASIGVALSRPSVTDVDALLRAADLAMYEAKASGHGGVCLLDDRILALGQRRMQIEADLPLAADRGELSIAYQPVVALDDHATTGAEALMRWQHPALGAIPPSEFIPIAEQIGEIHRLGHWLVEQAMRDLRSIRDGLPDLPAFLVGINLSARQLGVPGFADDFLRTVGDHGFTTDDVVVELTETVLMDATPNAEANIRRLADAGMAVTLDDFGTGYSSIDYLTRLPAKGVKLDMSFVRRLPDSPRSCAVATGLGVLCRQLGIDLIAEGVETPELLDEVIKVGATHAQGYLLAHPMPARELVALLADRPDLITDARPAR